MYKKFIFGFLALASIYLSGYAWFFGDRNFLLIFLFVSAIIAFNIWSSSNFAMRSISTMLASFLVITFGLGALYGAFVLVNSGYRESVADRRKESTAAAAAKLETGKAVAQLVEGLELTEYDMDDYRVGKLLIMLRRQDAAHLAFLVDSPTIPSSKDDYFVQVLEKGNTTSNLDKAGTIVWIQETSRVVGSYRRKLLGPITADKTGDALRYTWKVWLIDVKKKSVITHKEFPGPNPPETLEKYGDFGIPPQVDLAEWLASLPLR